MKAKSLLMGLLACVLVMFLHSNSAKAADEPPKKLMPQSICVCSKGENNKLTLTCYIYINGAYEKEYEKEISFEGRSQEDIHVACAYPTRSEKTGTTLTVWIAVNDGPNSRLERWLLQLTDQNAPPMVTQIDTTNLLSKSCTNIAANIVKGQDKIWYMCKDKNIDGKDVEMVYEKIGDSDFVKLGIERTAGGTWAMGDNGTVCWLSPQGSSNFVDTEQPTQPMVEWFSPGDVDEIKWRYLLPKAYTECGVALDNNTIMYVDYRGNTLIIKRDLKDPKDPNKLSQSPPIKPGYIAAMRMMETE